MYDNRYISLSKQIYEGSTPERKSGHWKLVFCFTVLNLSRRINGGETKLKSNFELPFYHQHDMHVAEVANISIASE